MICIGYNLAEKQAEVLHYISEHDVSKVFVFYPKTFRLTLPSVEIPQEHIEWADVIMYKFFYRLLEEIGPSTLLVFHECLRTQNRSELTYNCLHHYANQTSHKLVFEHFPFIEDRQDFMILLDLLDKGRYKGRSFDWLMLAEQGGVIKPYPYSLEVVNVPVKLFDAERYLVEKDRLFANLGKGDPDTIPRHLHVWAGNLKKAAIDPRRRYVARNKRFNLPNVTTYRECVEPDCTVIDFPHRRLDVNDWLKRTGTVKVRFLSTGLKVDLYYIAEFQAWLKRLQEFYAQAKI